MHCKHCFVYGNTLIDINAIKTLFCIYKCIKHSLLDGMHCKTFINRWKCTVKYCFLYRNALL